MGHTVLGMTVLARLRVALPDRPGALARVASVIAEHGGNIVSVDAQRAGVVQVIDELLVSFPDDHDIHALQADLTTCADATLLSHQTAKDVDPIVRVLVRAAELVGSASADPDAELVRSVAELCASPAVWVSSVEDAVRYDAGRFALERGGAIALRTSELPAHLAEVLPAEVWLLAVPDPDVLSGRRIVFVARPLNNEFTSTEIARVEAMMALHDQVDRALAHP